VVRRDCATAEFLVRDRPYFALMAVHTILEHLMGATEGICALASTPTITLCLYR
jgi:hypothetical protein